MIRTEATMQHSLQSALATTEEALRGYALENESQFGADYHSVTNGVLEHREDGKYTELVVGEDPADILEATVAFDRGSPTKRGKKAGDIFVFKPGRSLARHSGEHVTELIIIDPSTGEAGFPEGIGPKRQKLAIVALRIIEDNFTNDREMSEAV